MIPQHWKNLMLSDDRPRHGSRGTHRRADADVDCPCHSNIEDIESRYKTHLASDEGRTNPRFIDIDIRDFR